MHTHTHTHIYGSQETKFEHNGEQVLIEVKYLLCLGEQPANTPSPRFFLSWLFTGNAGWGLVVDNDGESRARAQAKNSRIGGEQKGFGE